LPRGSLRGSDAQRVLADYERPMGSSSRPFPDVRPAHEIKFQRRPDFANEAAMPTMLVVTLHDLNSESSLIKILNCF